MAAEVDVRALVDVTNEAPRKRREGKRAGAVRPPKKRRTCTRSLSAANVENRESTSAPSSSSSFSSEANSPAQRTGPQIDRHWRHGKRERRKRRQHYEELRRQGLQEELEKEEEAARMKWERLEEVCLKQKGLLPTRSGLSANRLIKISTQLNTLGFFFQADGNRYCYEDVCSSTSCPKR